MTRSSGYSENEINQMQEEALARVRRMQEIARGNNLGGQDLPELPPPQPDPPSPTPNTNNNIPLIGNISNMFTRQGGSQISSLLNNIGSDKIIILALILLLLNSEQEGEQTLLLALCYLLFFD